MTEEQQSDFAFACDHGNVDVIDSMLENGFDINYLAHNGSPLQIACMRKEAWVVDVVTKLIIHGADVDMEDLYGWTALSHCLHTHPVQRYPVQQPFQRHIAQLLLDCSKLGVNRLTSKDTNYLHCANTPEACKFLINNGIEVNNVDFYGKTIIDYTLAPEIRDYLISVGAKRASEL